MANYPGLPEDIFSEDDEEYDDDDGFEYNDGDEDEGDGGDNNSSDRKKEKKDKDEKKEDKSKKDDSSKELKTNDSKSKKPDSDTSKSKDLSTKPSDKPKKNTPDNKKSSMQKENPFMSGLNTLSSGKKALGSAKNSAQSLADGDVDEALKSGADTAKNAVDTAKNAKKLADQLAKQAAKKTAEQAAKQTAAHGAKAIGAKAIAAGGPYVWLAVAIIFLILLIILIVVCLSVIIAGKAYNEDPESMSSNSLISSDLFYGTRSVYIDNEALANSLQLSYKQFVVEVFEHIDANDSSITIEISLPEEFDNSTDIGEDLNNLSMGIANIVATGSTHYVDIEFSSLYPQISYFGFTANQSALVNDFITEYATNKPLITKEGSAADNIAELVDNAMNAAELQYMNTLYEKVMIKDEIATEEGLSEIEIRNYVASIYMPNQNIIITDSYISFTNETESNIGNTIRIVVENDGNQAVIAETTVEEKSGFVDGPIIPMQISQFTSIDDEDTSLFSEGMSLFDAVKTTPSGRQYFLKLTNEAGQEYYTWRPLTAGTTALYVTFEPSSPDAKFIFTDAKLDVVAAK